MTLQLRNLSARVTLTCLALSACSQGSNAPRSETVAKTPQSQTTYNYVLMDEFNHNMGTFVGLIEGESFETSKPKIEAVFTAYDGHAAPADISMDKDVVEAGWTQVLTTQEGLLDDTVAGQQLLAIYDDEGKLVTYGMRIKCHVNGSVSDWQNTVCG